MLFTRILSYSSRIRSRFAFSLRNRGYNDIALDDLPEVSTSLIRKTLRSNTNFEEGFTCFLIPCKFCHNKHVKTAKVYVNKTTGMYLCSCSKTTGHWSQFEQSVMKVRKRSKEVENAPEVDHISETVEGIKRDTAGLNLLPENELKSVLRKFKLPVVSLESLSNVDVRIDSNQSTLYFPLENVESNTVGYRKLSLSSTETVTLPNITCGGLLTSRASTKSKDTVIVVPNVSDFLVLVNSKLSVSVVCLPNGVDSLSQYCLPSFERFKKLILWLGNDDKSWNVARHFARKLEEKRCLLVRPTDKQDLPHLNPDQDFKSVISNAQQMWHKSITTFSTLRADVYSDLLNIDKVQGVKWKRYPTLNKILKGHRRGELTVITGPTGSGKTTFISEYSLDLAMQGVNTLWGSFEIRNARLAKTMLQQMAGFPFDEQLNLFDTWADKFEKLPVYFMTFHGQQAVKVVMEAVEQATYIYDIAHVIIDNVQFMMGMSEDQKHVDRFWKQDMVIGAFRQFATRKNCHVTLVIHPRKERNDDDLTTSSIFGGAKASQEADNVLIIQDKRLTMLRGKKYLQVAKNRYSGDLGIMALDFDKDGLSYQQKKSRDRKSVEEQTVDKAVVV